MSISTVSFSVTLKKQINYFIKLLSPMSENVTLCYFCSCFLFSRNRLYNTKYIVMTAQKIKKKKLYGKIVSKSCKYYHKREFYNYIYAIMQKFLSKKPFKTSYYCRNKIRNNDLVLKLHFIKSCFFLRTSVFKKQNIIL